MQKIPVLFLGSENRKNKVLLENFPEFTLTITQNSHFDLKTVTIESYGQFRWSFDHKYAEFTVLFDFSSILAFIEFICMAVYAFLVEIISHSLVTADGTVRGALVHN